MYFHYIQPFWPTGSGAARGFLACLDACYLMSEWCAGHRSVLELLAERESIFRLLAQTTSENIAKDYKNYTVKPTTRYFHKGIIIPLFRFIDFIWQLLIYLSFSLIIGILI